MPCPPLRSLSYNQGVPRQKLVYTYDYMGRRVRQQVYNYSGGWVLQATQKFVWQGWTLLAELNASNAVQQAYSWNGRQLLGLTQGSTTYLAVYDSKSVTGLVNATTGALDAAYEYDPYGNLLRASGPYAAQNPIRYSNYYTDVETGLIYYGYRYYNPANGRFINRDPIGETGGRNLYGFVGNDPVNGYDMLGLTNVNDDNHGEPEYTPGTVIGGTYRVIGKTDDGNYLVEILDPDRAKGFETDFYDRTGQSPFATNDSLWDMTVDFNQSYNENLGGMPWDRSDLAHVESVTDLAWGHIGRPMDIPDMQPPTPTGPDRSSLDGLTMDYDGLNMENSIAYGDEFLGLASFSAGTASSTAGLVQNRFTFTNPITKESFWLSKRLKDGNRRYYAWTTPGNGATGGKLSYAGKISSVAETWGRRFFIVSSALSLYDASTSFIEGDNWRGAGSTVDLIAGGYSTFGGAYGLAFGVGYTAGTVINENFPEVAEFIGDVIYFMNKPFYDWAERRWW